MLSCRAFVQLLLVLLFIALPAAAQTRSIQEDALREHRARAEKMQREAQARAEAAHRKMGLKTRPSHRGLPPVGSPNTGFDISPAGKAYMAKARADMAAREAARIKPRFT